MCRGKLVNGVVVLVDILILNLVNRNAAEAEGELAQEKENLGRGKVNSESGFATKGSIQTKVWAA